MSENQWTIERLREIEATMTREQIEYAVGEIFAAGWTDLRSVPLFIWGQVFSEAKAKS